MRLNLLNVVVSIAVVPLAVGGCLDFDQFLQDGGGAAGDVSMHADIGPRPDTGYDAGADSAFDAGSDTSYPSDASDDTGDAGLTEDTGGDAPEQDGGLDGGEDTGFDGGVDGGSDAGEEYVIQQSSVYQTVSGTCSNDEFDLLSTSGWGAMSIMENDEFVSKGKVLFVK
jgi:hypothetical protein